MPTSIEKVQRLLEIDSEIEDKAAELAALRAEKAALVDDPDIAEARRALGRRSRTK